MEKSYSLAFFSGEAGCRALHSLGLATVNAKQCVEIVERGLAHRVCAIAALPAYTRCGDTDILQKAGMGVLGKALLTGSLLTVIAGVGIVAVVHRSYEGPDGVQSHRFDGIATDLSRFGHTMQLIPKVFEAHVSTFLVKSGKNFVLIDAGWPTQNHTQLFMAALKDATRAGTLRWILLTHGYVSVSFI